MGAWVVVVVVVGYLRGRAREVLDVEAPMLAGEVVVVVVMMVMWMDWLCSGGFGVWEMQREREGEDGEETSWAGVEAWVCT
jgi:hypothetical protein